MWFKKGDPFEVENKNGIWRILFYLIFRIQIVRFYFKFIVKLYMTKRSNVQDSTFVPWFSKWIHVRKVENLLTIWLLEIVGQPFQNVFLVTKILRNW